MVNYGLNSKWRFNVETGTHMDLYTGTIIEEDEISLKISTIKDEVRVFAKSDIKSAKMYEDENGDTRKVY
jgi:hypothetical protein